MTDKTSKIVWRKDFENLEENDKILTDMKHGYISGRWDKKEKCVKGYYWRDMEWYPYAFVLIKDIENVNNS